MLKSINPADDTLRNAIPRACALYNRLTNPAAMRTDREHERCRRAARRVRVWFLANARRGVHYVESDSGRYWPL